MNKPEVKREFSYCVLRPSWGPLRLIQGHSEGHGSNQGHPPLTLQCEHCVLICGASD